MNMKRAFVLIGLLITLSAGILFYPRVRMAYDRFYYDRENRDALASVVADNIRPVGAQKTVTPAANEAPIPDKAYLKVPFFCQAPHQNDSSWTVHYASCEEAALLQAVFYERGVDSVHVDTVDAVLRRMLDWQLANFGVHKDIHADSIKMLMMGFFNYLDEEIIILRDAQIDEIKEWISKGYPVIAPTYGRWLHNPYYKQPGPEYHMVTVVGYTEDRLITNDVGTKRGKDFSYALDLFKKSMDKEGADCLVILRPKKPRGLQ